MFLIAMATILTFILLSEYRKVSSPPQRMKSHHYRSHMHVLKKALLPLTLRRSSQVVNQSVVEQVDTFVMFLGYPRSGHSIVASCLDAHPDAIVAHEFNLLVNMMQPELLKHVANRTALFDSLYQNSFRESLLGWRSVQQRLGKKGYTLNLNSSDSWQGRFRRLKVIGDKSGGLTTHAYRDSPASFLSAYEKLTSVVEVPIRFIHVVRNPYDIVATKLLYRQSEQRGKKGNFSAERPVRNAHQIMLAVKSLEAEVKAVQELISKWKLVTLEVHNADFIFETKRTMMDICTYLGLECSEKYLQLCKEAAYDKPRKSRAAIAWTEPSRQHVDKLIQDYPFLTRYSFTSF